MSDPAEFHHMGKAHADALYDLSRVFNISGYMAWCRGCKRSLPVTYDGRLMHHADGCEHFAEQHPWARLRAVLNGQAPATEVSK